MIFYRIWCHNVHVRAKKRVCVHEYLKGTIAMNDNSTIEFDNSGIESDNTTIESDNSFYIPPAPPVREVLERMIKRSGLNLHEISQRSQIPESSIRNVLKGVVSDPRYSTVRAITFATGGSVDEVLALMLEERCAKFDNSIAKFDNSDVKLDNFIESDNPREAAPMHEDASLHIPDWRALYTPELAELFADAPMGPVGYERALKYIKKEAADAHAEAAASHTANAHIREQNTELVRMNSGLLEQLSATRSRNRALYTGIIIACVVAGLCLAGLVGYVIYDIMSPSWGAVRY